jgi:hypothetical protein
MQLFILGGEDGHRNVVVHATMYQQAVISDSERRKPVP